MAEQQPQKGKTSNTPKGIPAKAKASPELYFHPDSGTFLLFEAKDNKLLEQEQTFLSQLMENQLAAKESLENIADQCLVLAKTNPRAAEMKLKPAYAKVNETTEKLREALKYLTPAVNDGKLLSANTKSSAIGIMELIPMSKRGAAGFKMTYVRSDKIANHVRKYELSKGDTKSASNSFLKKTVTTSTPDANGNTKEKTTYKIDSEKLLKQFSAIKPSIKSSIAGTDIIKNADFILTDWAKEHNKTLEHALDDINQMYKDSSGVDLSAQAQLMRFSRGLSASADYNPLDKQLNAKVKGHASFVLGEAKGEFKKHFPDKMGTEMTYPNKSGKEGTLGHIKAVITIAAAGSVGASLGVEAGLLVDWGGKTAKGYGIRGANTKLELKSLPGMQKSNISLPVPDAQLGGELSAFAGLEASLNLAGTIEWKSPEENHDFKVFAKLMPGITLQAGAGASGKFYITFVKGKFRIFCKAGLCWGAGAKGSIGFDVDAGLLVEFMPMFTHMLRNMDYIKMVELMAPDAFEMFCMLPILALSAGVQISELAVNELQDALIILQNDLAQESKRVKLMQSINNDPDKLKFTTPETKGAIIATLMNSSIWDGIDPRNQNNDLTTFNAYKWGTLKRRKQAIFNALMWVQSKSDYENVMQHLTMTPGAGKDNWKTNQQKVINFLSGSEIKWMGNFSTQYGEKIEWLYQNLPDRKSIDPSAPLKPIPRSQMDKYLAFVETTHNSTMTA
ncbi:hypothetical protein QQF21_04565 [Lelliottia sp. V89_10]|uniref:hypothetical protein n=1 Tax=Lelliottia wanjuensis TaxID=3050585 RepID=UPI00249F0E26|nr:MULTISPECIES: hypothetical protein [unclassified Lelliottia]MDI3360055.1 hypothetical protein [Lelliottia sp. V89_13]MDK9548281.1 hypothetical protein [Lelliottia sp. V89_5]MDK9594879.1 hypothetical protein [Lelliottia sp. V89_10]